jgi:hypothetical protein
MKTGHTRTHRILEFALTAVLVAFSSNTHAADLSLYIGGIKPGSISYHNVQTSLDASPVFGIRLNTNIVPHFGLEHTLAFSSDFLFPGGVSAIKNANGFLYNSNLLISLPGKFAVPYITAGVGLMHQYGDSDLPVGTKFAFNYGGGLKFPHVAGPLGFRLDLRGYRAGVFSDKLNLFEISGGVFFSFPK